MSLFFHRRKRPENWALSPLYLLSQLPPFRRTDRGAALASPKRREKNPFLNSKEFFFLVRRSLAFRAPDNCGGGERCNNVEVHSIQKVGLMMNFGANIALEPGFSELLSRLGRHRRRPWSSLLLLLLLLDIRRGRRRRWRLVVPFFAGGGRGPLRSLGGVHGGGGGGVVPAVGLGDVVGVGGLLASVVGVGFLLDAAAVFGAITACERA